MSLGEGAVLCWPAATHELSVWLKRRRTAVSFDAIERRFEHQGLITGPLTDTERAFVARWLVSRAWRRSAVAPGWRRAGSSSSKYDNGRDRSQPLRETSLESPESSVEREHQQGPCQATTHELLEFSQSRGLNRELPDGPRCGKNFTQRGVETTQKVAWTTESRTHRLRPNAGIQRAMPFRRAELKPPLGKSKS